MPIGSDIFTSLEEIKESQILVLVIPDKQYTDRLQGIVKELSNNYQSICYVSLNRPYRTLKKNFEENRIDIGKFFFIDAITKTAEIPTPTENCEFISSPNALTELSLAISNSLERKKFDYILFDSLSTLLVYESDIVVTQFVHFLMAKIRVVGCRAIFTCLKQDLDSVLLKDINMFADRVIDMEYWSPDGSR